MFLSTAVSLPLPKPSLKLCCKDVVEALCLKAYPSKDVAFKMSGAK